MAIKRRAPRPAKPAKQFFSMREVRVTSTDGPVAIVPANKPKLLPECLWLEAIRKGCIEFDAELIEAAAAAARAAVEDEDAPEDGRDANETTANPREAVRQAVLQVAMLNDEKALTKEGVPKVAVVKRLLDDPTIQVTSELVYDLFLEMQDAGTFEEEALEKEDSLEDLEQRVDQSGLEDPDGSTEPVGGGLAAVLEEANAGGSVDDEE